MSNQSKIYIIFLFVFIVFLFQGDFSFIRHYQYYDSVEEALLNSDMADRGDEYQETITQEIFRTENDDYVTMYYRSKKEEGEECITLAKFKVINNGRKQYRLSSWMASEVSTGDMENKDGIDLVRLNLSGLDIIKSLGIDPEHKTFMCGQNGDVNIKNLKIDGQAPDGVVPFTVIGKQRYFWYYYDLKTDKRVDKMVITMQ